MGKRMCTTELVAHLLRSVVTLGPDDLHFLAVLALETLDFIRNLLIEEVSIGRMRMYFAVIRNWPLCFLD